MRYSGTDSSDLAKQFALNMVFFGHPSNDPNVLSENAKFAENKNNLAWCLKLVIQVHGKT